MEMVKDWAEKCGLFLSALVGGTIFLAVYPLWFLFSALVNRVGLDGVRMANGKLQVAVVFYRQPVTKREVVFVATIHLAEVGYFKELEKLIDPLEAGGYKVLFEMIKKIDQEEQESLTEEEQKILAEFESIRKFAQKIGEILSLQHQRDGLNYSDSWVNTDMSRRELVKWFLGRKIHLVKREREDMDEFFDDDESHRLIVRYVIVKLFNQIMPISLIGYLAGLLFERGRRAREVILEHRNKIGFNGIAENIACGNVVTIWGAAHLRGIGRRIKKVGFREYKREWFTAYHQPKFSLFDLIKELIRIREKKSAEKESPEDKNGSAVQITPAL